MAILGERNSGSLFPRAGLLFVASRSTCGCSDRSGYSRGDRSVLDRLSSEGTEIPQPRRCPQARLPLEQLAQESKIQAHSCEAEKSQGSLSESSKCCTPRGTHREALNVDDEGAEAAAALLLYRHCNVAAPRPILVQIEPLLELGAHILVIEALAAKSRRSGAAACCRRRSRRNSCSTGSRCGGVCALAHLGMPAEHFNHWRGKLRPRACNRIVITL